MKTQLVPADSSLALAANTLPQLTQERIIRLKIERWGGGESDVQAALLKLSQHPDKENRLARMLDSARDQNFSTGALGRILDHLSMSSSL